MKIIALEREKTGLSAADFQPFLQAEAVRLWELVKSGVVRETYFDAQVHTAVLIMECSNLDEAGRVLATLPLVKNGLIEFDLIPLAPYTGFERLFSSK
jgi:hypothetical protein